MTTRYNRQIEMISTYMILKDEIHREGSREEINLRELDRLKGRVDMAALLGYLSDVHAAELDKLLIEAEADYNLQQLRGTINYREVVSPDYMEPSSICSSREEG